MFENGAFNNTKKDCCNLQQVLFLLLPNLLKEFFYFACVEICYQIKCIVLRVYMANTGQFLRRLFHNNEKIVTK